MNQVPLVLLFLNIPNRTIMITDFRRDFFITSEMELNCFEEPEEISPETQCAYAVIRIEPRQPYKQYFVPPNIKEAVKAVQYAISRDIKEATGNAPSLTISSYPFIHDRQAAKMYIPEYNYTPGETQ